MMKRLLLVLALAVIGTTAGAQQWSGGVRYQWGDALVGNVTVEWPSFDLLGLRAGPSVTVQGHVGPDGFGATAMAGVTIAFVTGIPELLAVAIDINYRVVWQTGESTRYGPGIGVYAAGSF